MVQVPSWSRGVRHGETGPLGRSGVVGWNAWVGSKSATLDLLLDVMDDVSDGGSVVRAFLMEPDLEDARAAGFLARIFTGGVSTEAMRLKKSKMSPRY